jgi:hypothetical protein
MVAAAIVGGAVVSGVASNSAAKKSARAAQSASDTQSQQAYAAMEQQNEQFNRVQELLSPYSQAATGGHFDWGRYLRENPDVAADPYFSQRPQEHYDRFGKYEGRAYTGTQGSLEAQQNLAGLNGAEAQGRAISGIENSPYFSGLVKQGENAILQNASATGGLRGGNTQAALAQVRPNMLAAAIDQQYQRLGGLTSLGQNAAAGVGNAGMNAANANSQLLGQVGAAQAGGYLAQGRAQAQGINGIASAFGTAAPQLAGYFNQPSYGQGITGTAGGNAGEYSTGATLNNDYGGAATYF